MRIEKAERVNVFTIFDAPRLDPIVVVLQDVGPSAGRLLVECCGSAWSGYWVAMGDDGLKSFLIHCSPQYIAVKMHPLDRKMLKREESYLLRIIEAVHSSLLSNAGVTGAEPKAERPR